MTGQLLTSLRSVGTGALADDADWMALALEAARESAALGEVPVGAVVVHRPKEGGPARWLVTSHNQPIALNDPTAHAEMLALRQAAALMGNYRLDECELYVTLEPCAMCAQAMLHARLRRVVYGATEPKTGAAGSVMDLFSESKLNHQTSILRGLRADECAQLMRDFFQQKRQQAKRVSIPLRDDALRTPESRFEPVWSVYPNWRSASHYTQQLPALQRLRLHWLDVGSVTEAAPWVALHGPQAWWPQLATWAQDRTATGERVLLPDLIGFGQSDKPKRADWHSLALHARILLEWLDELGLGVVQWAVAPGQNRLAAELQAQAPHRVSSVLHLQPGQLVELPEDWQQLPYPDAGHQAAPKVWRKSGWAQAPGQ